MIQLKSYRIASIPLGFNKNSTFNFAHCRQPIYNHHTTNNHFCLFYIEPQFSLNFLQFPKVYLHTFADSSNLKKPVWLFITFKAKNKRSFAQCFKQRAMVLEMYCRRIEKNNALSVSTEFCRRFSTWLLETVLRDYGKVDYLINNALPLMKGSRNVRQEVNYKSRHNSAILPYNRLCS